MFRVGAVREAILDVAGLSPRRFWQPQPDGDGTDAAAPVSGKEAHEIVARARRRALAAVGIDWLSILVLVVVRGRTGPVLPLGAGEETVIALALLAIATHSGFRLGQHETYRAAAHALDELDQRTDSS